MAGAGTGTGLGGRWCARDDDGGTGPGWLWRSWDGVGEAGTRTVVVRPRQGRRW